MRSLKASIDGTANQRAHLSCPVCKHHRVRKGRAIGALHAPFSIAIPGRFPLLRPAKLPNLGGIGALPLSRARHGTGAKHGVTGH